MSKRDQTLSALGQNIRKRRVARELTQEKLAEKSGLDATCISGIERGFKNRCGFDFPEFPAEGPKRESILNAFTLANLPRYEQNAVCTIFLKASTKRYLMKN